MLSELGRDTRQHINDTILSYFDDTQGKHDPVTVGIRINCLPKGELGCVYLCVMEENERGKLYSVKRFRFKPVNWCHTVTLAERYLLLALMRAEDDFDKTVTEALTKIADEIKTNRQSTLSLTVKQISYFTAPLIGRRKSIRWKDRFLRFLRSH